MEATKPMDGAAGVGNIGMVGQQQQKFPPFRNIFINGDISGDTQIFGDLAPYLSDEKMRELFSDLEKQNDSPQYKTKMRPARVLNILVGQGWRIISHWGNGNNGTFMLIKGIGFGASPNLGGYPGGRGMMFPNPYAAMYGGMGGQMSGQMGGGFGQMMGGGFGQMSGQMGGGYGQMDGSDGSNAGSGGQQQQGLNRTVDPQSPKNGWEKLEEH